LPAPGPKGTVSFMTFKPTAPVRIELRFAGAGAYAASTSPAVNLAETPSISLNLSSDKVKPKKIVTFTGLLAGYGRYLFDERALSEHTVLVRYVPTVRLFLEGVMGAGGPGLERLSAGAVSLFLARECQRRGGGGGRELVVALRSFLRYLHVEGLISTPPEWAVPGSPICGIGHCRVA
jgi:hypothetical protein